MDNATVNDVFASTLALLLQQRYGIHFTPENGQIRCLAHVVNLIVQVFLKHLDEVPDHPDENDYYEQNKNKPFHYDPLSDEDQTTMETEDAAREDNEAAGAEDEENVADEGEVCTETSPIKKVRYYILLIPLWCMFQQIRFC